MIIYGKQLFLHVLDRHPEILKEIYLTKECDKNLFKKIVRLNLPTKRLDFKKAQSLAKGGNHQGFLALCEDFKFAKISDLKKSNFITILYNLNDIGNIGAITRTAYALGCDGIVVVCKNLAIEGVVRASCGGAFEIPIAICENGLDLLNELKQCGFKIFATAANGDSCFEKSEKIALVMGNEGDGLLPKVLSKCDKTLAIKMKNSFDSLNVSVTFAIFCDRILNGRF